MPKRDGSSQRPQDYVQEFFVRFVWVCGFPFPLRSLMHVLYSTTLVTSTQLAGEIRKSSMRINYLSVSSTHEFGVLAFADVQVFWGCAAVAWRILGRLVHKSRAMRATLSVWTAMMIATACLLSQRPSGYCKDGPGLTRPSLSDSLAPMESLKCDSEYTSKCENECKSGCEGARCRAMSAPTRNKAFNASSMHMCRGSEKNQSWSASYGGPVGS